MDSNLNRLLAPEEPAAPPITATPQPIPAIGKEADLAKLLGISASRCRTLTADGVLKKIGRNRFDVAASVTAYCARLRESAERAGRPSAQPDDVKAAAGRLKAAQADLAEIKAAQARGELVPSADVVREWSNLLRDLRNALLAVPSRCGASLPHLTATDIATLEREIRAALEGFSNAD